MQICEFFNTIKKAYNWYKIINWFQNVVGFPIFSSNWMDKKCVYSTHNRVMVAPWTSQINVRPSLKPFWNYPKNCFIQKPRGIFKCYNILKTIFLHLYQIRMMFYSVLEQRLSDYYKKIFEKSKFEGGSEMCCLT